MIQNPTLVGLPTVSGANGPLNYAECNGSPNINALDLNTYAVGCILFQRDASTGYVVVVWQNTATTFGTPTWTQVPTGQTLAGGSTRTLTAAQTGSTILMDTASGTVVTLPAPVVGLKYTFIISNTVTSNSHKVITNAGTVFMVGMVGLMEASAAAALGALFDGSANVAITMNGSTTGGIKGTRFTLECISATVWEISGLVAGSGSLSTPAANS